MANSTLDISALETWLWEAACVIRGAVDTPRYKDHILPLIFLKRPSDVFDDELADLGPTATFDNGTYRIRADVVFLINGNHGKLFRALLRSHLSSLSRLSG